MNDQGTNTDDVDFTELQREAETDKYTDPAPVTAAHVLRSGPVMLRTPQEMVLDAVEMVKHDLPSDASPEVQTVVAEILNLMEALLASAQPITRMAMAEFALHRVVKAPNDLTLAKKVLGNLRRNLGGSVGLWFTRVRIATPPHVDVVIGLTASVLIFGGLFLFTGFGVFRAIGLSPTIASDDFLQSLVWLGAVGAFGSVISILTRLNDFAKKAETSAWLDFMNGFFKPVIGLAAADLFFILIQSRMLPLDFTAATQTYAFVGIAFVAGFSERLFKDLVSIVERSVGAAGERGIEFQRTGAQSRAMREVRRDLSGRTEVSRAEIYDSVDLGDLDEVVEPQWDENARARSGGEDGL